MNIYDNASEGVNSIPIYFPIPYSKYLILQDWWTKEIVCYEDREENLSALESFSSTIKEMFTEIDEAKDTITVYYTVGKGGSTEQQQKTYSRVKEQV